MLNDRDRHLLKGLERQLEKEDPTSVHQFKVSSHQAGHAAISAPR